MVEWILWSLIPLVAVCEMISLVKDIRRKRGWYNLKCFVNNFRPAISLLMFVYLLMFGAIVYTKDIEPSLTVAKSSSVFVSAIMQYGSPLFFLGILYWIGFPLIKNFTNPWWEYNDKEKDWQKEERLKFRARLPKFLQRWVKV